MSYKINGVPVTKEEWDDHTVSLKKKPGFRPIQSGSKFQLQGAQAFDGFVSPIDNSFVNSEHKLREHNAEHSVRQVGNDLKKEGVQGRTRQESINKQKGNCDD